MPVCVYVLRIEPRGVERGIGLPCLLALSSALSRCWRLVPRTFLWDMGHLSTDLTKVSLRLISYWATVGRGLLVLCYHPFWSNLEPPSEISPR